MDPSDILLKNLFANFTHVHRLLAFSFITVLSVPILHFRLISVKRGNEEDRIAVAGLVGLPPHVAEFALVLLSLVAGVMAVLSMETIQGILAILKPSREEMAAIWTFPSIVAMNPLIGSIGCLIAIVAVSTTFIRISKNLSLGENSGVLGLMLLYCGTCGLLAWKFWQIHVA